MDDAATALREKRDGAKRLRRRCTILKGERKFLEIGSDVFGIGVFESLKVNIL